jgi:hypothetical protein
VLVFGRRAQGRQPAEHAAPLRHAGLQPSRFRAVARCGTRDVDDSLICRTAAEPARTRSCLDVDEIVVAIDDRRNAFPVQELLDCKLRGIQVTDAITFFERETGKVKLDLLYPSWMIFSDGFSRNLLHSRLQRLFDVIASLLAAGTHLVDHADYRTGDLAGERLQPSGALPPGAGRLRRAGCSRY